MDFSMIEIEIIIIIKKTKIHLTSSLRSCVPLPIFVEANVKWAHLRFALNDEEVMKLPFMCLSFCIRYLGMTLFCSF
jgi:hypothetical protein